jgi:DNA-binding response OmpR family regulator
LHILYYFVYISGDTNHKIEALEAGMNAYMIKPLTPEKLEEVLRTLL